MAAVPQNLPTRIVVAGGGAAGFFAAIAAAESNPKALVTLLERSAHVLSKVKISGGGRCNVTNACFDPAELVRHYPRGSQALRGPFTRFQPRDTVEWFESRGVPLKTEPDNRMFPVSDQSATIIECLKAEAVKAGVTVRVNVIIHKVEASPTTPQRGGPPSPTGRGHLAKLSPLPVGEGPGVRRRFSLDLGAESLECDRLILATGSNPQAWDQVKTLGHTLVQPVASLFTFNISDPRLEDLSGLSVKTAEVSIEGTKLRQRGPVLITHWGLSGPAVLKLSAWGARELHVRDYHASLKVNWAGEKPDAMIERLKTKRGAHAHNMVAADNFPEIPRRLWARLAGASGLPEGARWAEVGNEPLRAFAEELTGSVFEIQGKSTFKEEFVTAGGVPLDEVDFRTMESKRCPGLYLAGEILDIDGETGGFNFQNAWTTGWIAGRSSGSSELV